MTDLQPTPAAQWRGRLVELPSGKVARLRAVGLDTFIRGGNIPDALTPLLAEDAGEAETRPLSRAETLRQHIDLVDAIVCAAFVEPRVVKGEPGAGEISVLDVDEGDRAFVMREYQTILNLVEPFRQEQTADVQPVALEPVGEQATE